MASPADSKVFCSFCEEGFESSEFMMDHLMICGNKTDPCPNCGKYVRRAIFAYHYENNCANFDEPPTDNEKHNKSQSSNGIRVDVHCPHCNENYEKNTDKNHRKNCRLNPDNQANGQHQSLYPGLDQTSDESRQYNNSDDDVRIPCEWCSQGIPLHLFDNHSKACRDHEHKRLLEKRSRSADHSKTNQSINSSSPRRPSQNIIPAININIRSVIQNIKCKFCHRPFSLQGHTFHELNCVKNGGRNKRRK